MVNVGGGGGRQIVTIAASQMGIIMDVILSLIQAATAVEAYCLYRLNKLDDALESLKGIEKDSAIMLLESQILFRREKMDASVDIYQKHQKSKIESLEINLVAGLVSAGRSSEVQVVMDVMRVKASSSFELAYNTTCALV
ncbi:signal recognition particle subunit SRP72 [Tanacetum coccineum]